MNLRLSQNIDDIFVEESGKIISSSHPLSQYKVLKSFEESGSACSNTGWSPIYFNMGDLYSFSYIKSHSYGEYIFDWAWADLYQRLGLDYYPKLIHAIPFTPVNSDKVIYKNENSDPFDLLKEIKDFYLSNNLSSHHYLFVEKELHEPLEKLGYFKKKSLQYHMQVKFKDYDEYIGSLKARKRKQIKKERTIVEKFLKDNSYEVLFKRAIDLNKSELSKIYELYLTTIDKKFSHPYLTKEFFLNLDKFDECFLFLMKKGDDIDAMALFFESDDTLYGRYWGIKKEVAKRCSYLHFELCYYLGIEYAIDTHKSLFEAGAQGEHKLLRGFTPVEIISYHHIKAHELGEIIKEHTERQNIQIENDIAYLKEHLPFKHSNL